MEAKRCVSCGRLLTDTETQFGSRTCASCARPAGGLSTPSGSSQTPTPSAEPTKQSSDSTRVLAGVLLAGGPLLLALVIILTGAGCDNPEADPCLAWIAYFAVAIFVTIPMMVAGGLVALATIVPFGRFRRVMIGLGAAILAGAVTFILFWMVSDYPEGMEIVVGIVIASTAAAGFFYLSYTW